MLTSAPSFSTGGAWVPREDVPARVAASRAALLRVHSGQSRRLAASLLIAAFKHVVLLLWLAGLGSMVPAPPPTRILVSLDMLNSGGPLGEGRGASRAAGSSSRAPAPTANLAPPLPAVPVPAPAAPSREKEVVAKPEPVPRPPVATPRDVAKPKPPSRVPAPAAEAARDATPKPEGQLADGQVGSDGAVSGGAGTTAVGGGGQGSPGSGAGVVEASYRSRLIAWLASRKRYPARARAMGLEAEVVARITISRDGRVHSRVIEGGSGYGVFSREVEAMVDKANPFPKVPDTLSGELFEFRVPIAFRLADAGG